MTTTDDEDLDVRRLTEISRELPAIDLDAESAARISRRAADDLGKRPLRRNLELVLVFAIVIVYLVWVIGKVLELLG
ncbi:MAG: hypothetical protein JNL83_36905 [Myxococcales bacterium]|nr:hypothetical protein [Myxococcales bacterium]